ncbi:hypothetical protein F2Q70_00019030 [Brassica cretica]|uniref:SAM-dependent MTase RsmB/NOP-type domain-containing protein n=1 Tax=Brassica cretica TaxID=69181 RepID=A0A8S9I0S9_BRACR|nr:hypothetical protein F2Q70_00019030 [Brassica cretica]
MFLDSSKRQEVVTVDVSQAKILLQSDDQYLDVRTEEEFRRGHCFVPKILNVPYMLNSPQGRVKNQDFLDQVSSLLNPTDDILVGCQSGARSLNATTELVSALNLLRNGFRLLKQGGILVYSTCSLTHAQNEDVVDEFLAESSSAELQEIEMAKEWPCRSGRTPKTVRFDPSTSATSGLFVARIKKLAPEKNVL